MLAAWARAVLSVIYLALVYARGGVLHDGPEIGFGTVGRIAHQAEEEIFRQRAVRGRSTSTGGD